jgi:hypothetical protein
MATYRIRSVFRVLAALVSVAGIFGVSLLIRHVARSGDALLAGLVAAVVLLFAVPFGVIAWVGRVPAWAEEFGMDDLEQIFKHRADAHDRGDFVP